MALLKLPLILTDLELLKYYPQVSLFSLCNADFSFSCKFSEKFSHIRMQLYLSAQCWIWFSIKYLHPVVHSSVSKWIVFNSGFLAKMHHFRSCPQRMHFVVSTDTKITLIHHLSQNFVLAELLLCYAADFKAGHIFFYLRDFQSFKQIYE